MYSISFYYLLCIRTLRYHLIVLIILFVSSLNLKFKNVKINKVIINCYKYSFSNIYLSFCYFCFCRCCCFIYCVCITVKSSYRHKFITRFTLLILFRCNCSYILDLVCVGWTLFTDFTNIIIIRFNLAFVKTNTEHVEPFIASAIALNPIYFDTCE